jgi:hypothetical protein
MKIKILVLLVGVWIGLGLGVSSVNAAPEKEAVSAARSWLTLVDTGRYAESWKEAASYFQNAVSEQNWETSLTGVRTPLGRLVRRKLIKSQETASLPGAPDGPYVVMRFSTAFENKKSAMETVTFMLERDGKWRAAGYFIK